jgi:hypothetical protein
MDPADLTRISTLRHLTGALALGLLAACQAEPAGPTQHSLSAGAATVAPGSWIARADYPSDIYSAASTAVTSGATQRITLYVIGGDRRGCCGGAGQLTDVVWAYDVASDAWRKRAPLPVRLRSSNRAVEIDGRIYVSGGCSRYWDETAGVWRLTPVRSLFAYDPAGNTWTRKRDMPIETSDGVGATYQGRLYVAAQCYEEDYCGAGYGLGALWRYNPATGRWALLGSTPHRVDGGGGFIGGKLYLVSRAGDVDIYDPATGKWAAGPRRPFDASCGYLSGTLQARLYVVGRYDDDRPTTLVLDPAAGAWTEAAPSPVEPSGATLSRVLVNGQPRLQLVGGPRPGNNLQFVP